MKKVKLHVAISKELVDKLGGVAIFKKTMGDEIREYPSQREGILVQRDNDWPFLVSVEENYEQYNVIFEKPLNEIFFDPEDDISVMDELFVIKDPLVQKISEISVDDELWDTLTYADLEKIGLEIFDDDTWYGSRVNDIKPEEITEIRLERYNETELEESTVVGP